MGRRCGVTTEAAARDELRVQDNAERTRFEGYLGDSMVGVVEYIPLPGKIIATHTEVDPELEGQGIAAGLVTQMLDELRADGRLVQPLCAYVTSFLRGHPEYADVVDAATPH